MAATARLKGMAVAKRLMNPANPTVIIAADTVVVSPDGQLFEKPTDDDDSLRMLTSLQDNGHRVMTGVLVVAPEVPRGRLAAAGWIAGRAPRKTDREGCFSMGYLPPSKLPRCYLLVPERKNAFDFHRSSGRGVGAARACRVPLDRIARTI